MNYFTSIDALDHALNTWFLLIRTPQGIAFFSIVAFFGSWAAVSCVTFLLYALFRRSKLRSFFLPFIAGFVFAESATYLLKHLIARPRPFGGVYIEHSFSFPSGHATTAMIAYGFLAYALASLSETGRGKSFAVLGAILAIALIGLCRLYLSAHYLSDVLAGYLVGACGLVFAIYLHRKNSVNKALNKEYRNK